MATRLLDHAPAAVPLYVKALLPAIPVVGGLPGVKHASGGTPELVVQRRAVSTDLPRLAAYADVCGFGLKDTLPVTFPHLAAFGLQMSLMTDTSFPFAPMGLVHLRNSITQHRPIRTTEIQDVEVRAADLRPHRKGQLIDLVTTIRSGTDVVWEETTTLLARGGGSGEEQTTPPLEDVEPPVGPTRWQLGGDLGRRYAAVSGDRNPIHLYAITAKAFGFPRQIAHGMWTKARCIAALDGRLPDAYVVDVEFKRPILLPGTVTFGSRPLGKDLTFGVTGRARDGKPAPTHLVGRVTPA